MSLAPQKLLIVSPMKNETEWIRIFSFSPTGFSRTVFQFHHHQQAENRTIENDLFSWENVSSTIHSCSTYFPILIQCRWVKIVQQGSRKQLVLISETHYIIFQHDGDYFKKWLFVWYWLTINISSTIIRSETVKIWVILCLWVKYFIDLQLLLGIINLFFEWNRRNEIFSDIFFSDAFSAALTSQKNRNDSEKRCWHRLS